MNIGKSYINDDYINDEYMLNRDQIDSKRYCITSREQLLRTSKDVNIPVTGLIKITLLAQCFTDNKYFQRLDQLKQLGVCYTIFPGAMHTRKEHSFGTYALTDRILRRIKGETDECKLTKWLSKIPELKNHYDELRLKSKLSHKNNTINTVESNLSLDSTLNSKSTSFEQPKLGLTDWIIELVKIAALCHDIGHGPYSHLFDDIFIKNSEFKDHMYATHESRSCAIVEEIVKNSDILSKFLTISDIKFIQSIIDPPSNAKGFIYQIVSNDLNGLDIDKYDYINRDAYHTGCGSIIDFTRLLDNVLVINNNIVYPAQADQDILKLFTTRHSMHRRVYCHKGVVSAQYIIIDIMTILDPILGISSSILDLDNFVNMTDVNILSTMNLIVSQPQIFKNNNLITDDAIQKLGLLRQRLQNHDMYPHIGTILSKDKLNLNDYFGDRNVYMIFTGKVGFVSGNRENPLDNIYLYKTKDYFTHGRDVKAHKIDKNDITFLLPEKYQEHITIFYRRDRDLNSLAIDERICKKLNDIVKRDLRRQLKKDRIS